MTTLLLPDDPSALSLSSGQPEALTIHMNTDTVSVLTPSAPVASAPGIAAGVAAVAASPSVSPAATGKRGAPKGSAAPQAQIVLAPAPVETQGAAPASTLITPPPAPVADETAIDPLLSGVRLLGSTGTAREIQDTIDRLKALTEEANKVLGERQQQEEQARRDAFRKGVNELVGQFECGNVVGLLTRLNEEFELNLDAYLVGGHRVQSPTSATRASTKARPTTVARRPASASDTATTGHKSPAKKQGDKGHRMTPSEKHRLRMELEGALRHQEGPAADRRAIKYGVSAQTVNRMWALVKAEAKSAKHRKAA